MGSHLSARPNEKHFKPAVDFSMVGLPWRDEKFSSKRFSEFEIGVPTTNTFWLPFPLYSGDWDEGFGVSIAVEN